jgi:hypothetical protein
MQFHDELCLATVFPCEKQVFNTTFLPFNLQTLFIDYRQTNYAYILLGIDTSYNAPSFDPVTTSNSRSVATIMNPTIATEAPTSTCGVTATGQTADDDVKEGHDAVNDGEEDEADAIDDAHENAADGAKTRFELDELSAALCALAESRTYTRNHSSHFDLVKKMSKLSLID